MPLQSAAKTCRHRLVYSFLLHAFPQILPHRSIGYRNPRPDLGAMVVVPFGPGNGGTWWVDQEAWAAPHRSRAGADPAATVQIQQVLQLHLVRRAGFRAGGSRAASAGQDCPMARGGRGDPMHGARR